MLSKPIINCYDYSNEVSSNVKLITYENYITNKISLLKYKVSDLKYFLKQNKLHISGNKPALITRITELFTRIKNSILIQKIFRGFIVRFSNKLRGPAINARNLCINQCDFYTLEPLTEFVFNNFFSYKDDNGFIYGFDIFSLINLMKKVNVLKNPYNREIIGLSVERQIISLYKIINIIYPNQSVNENTEPVVALSRVPYGIINSRTRANQLNDDLMDTLHDIITSNNTTPNVSNHSSPNFNEEPNEENTTNNNSNNTENNNNNNNHLNPTTIPIENNIPFNNSTRTPSRTNREVSSHSTYRNNNMNRNYSQSRVFTNNNESNIRNPLFSRLYDLTNQPIHTRIQELFMEIDLLGNYTQSSWFSSLEQTDYIIFINNLFHIWNYRAHLSNEVKRNISQLYDPFIDHIPSHYNLETFSISTIQQFCLDVMEPMVLSGIDLEYRKLGTLYILASLTIVSIPARNTMSWLYESLVY
jgi:hypothetical protein